jgi:hypothetical protein
MIIIHPFHPLSQLHFAALLLLGQHSWLLVVVFPFKVAKWMKGMDDFQSGKSG